MRAFVVFSLVFSTRLARGNVSEMTCFVSSGTLNHNPINHRTACVSAVGPPVIVEAPPDSAVSVGDMLRLSCLVSLSAAASQQAPRHPSSSYSSSSSSSAAAAATSQGLSMWWLHNARPVTAGQRHRVITGNLRECVGSSNPNSNVVGSR